MSYINKRKIQIARGTSSNLINSNNYTSTDDQTQSPGQPAFISDKYYLTVGTGKEFNKEIPIRVRTVEGWTSDKENFNENTFSLSNTKNDSQHYRLTSEGDIVYLSSNPQFQIRHADTPLLTIDKQGNAVTINENKYLETKNIKTTFIKDISGIEKINFNGSEFSSAFGQGSYTINFKDNIYTDKILYAKNDVYMKKLNILENIVGWTSEISSTPVYSLNKDGTITASKSLTVPTINTNNINIINNGSNTVTLNQNDASYFTKGIKVNKLLIGNEDITNVENNNLLVTGAAKINSSLEVDSTLTCKGFTSATNSTVNGTLTVNAIVIK